MTRDARLACLMSMSMSMSMSFRTRISHLFTRIPQHNNTSTHLNTSTQHINTQQQHNTSTQHTPTHPGTTQPTFPRARAFFPRAVPSRTPSATQISAPYCIARIARIGMIWCFFGVLSFFFTPFYTFYTFLPCGAFYLVALLALLSFGACGAFYTLARFAKRWLAFEIRYPEDSGGWRCERRRAEEREEWGGEMRGGEER